jgi:nitronate monooxygenase
MAEEHMPPLRLGDFEMSLPIVQGAMGVGISLDGLVSAVIKEGCMGTLSPVGGGEVKGYVGKMPYVEANTRALREEIREVRRRTRGYSGGLAVNVMTVLTDAQALIETALEENVDVLVSGAGIKKDLPKLMAGAKTLMVPIVSSARVAEALFEVIWGPQGRIPDAVIVEGPMAGGHLGFKKYDPKKPLETRNLNNPKFVAHGVEEILGEVLAVVRKYETPDRKIPVIVGGGVYYGGDIKKFLALGASGVQMATRFVTTYECDASMAFKQAYLDSKEKDIILIDSPAGMPGRAINNEFLESVARGKRIPANCPFHCLITCNPKESPYCIAQALVNARRGNLEEGYAFAGANAWRCEELVTVPQLIKNLKREFKYNLASDSSVFRKGYFALRSLLDKKD